MDLRIDHHLSMVLKYRAELKVLRGSDDLAWRLRHRGFLSVHDGQHPVRRHHSLSMRTRQTESRNVSSETKHYKTIVYSSVYSLQGLRLDTQPLSGGHEGERESSPPPPPGFF